VALAVDRASVEEWWQKTDNLMAKSNVFLSYLNIPIETGGREWPKKNIWMWIA
jgi:hypothetical protein